MIHVIASISIRKGAMKDYIAAFNKNVQNVVAEEGCIEYSPVIDLPVKGIKTQELDPQVLTVVEKWESLAALKTHAKSQHMMDLRDVSAHMVEGIKLKVLQEA